MAREVDMQLAHHDPEKHREPSADEPEPVEVDVERPRSEHALGADDAPDDGRGEERAAVGAGEMSRLVPEVNASVSS